MLGNIFSLEKISYLYTMTKKFLALSYFLEGYYYPKTPYFLAFIFFLESSRVTSSMHNISSRIILNFIQRQIRFHWLLLLRSRKKLRDILKSLASLYTSIIPKIRLSICSITTKIFLLGIKMRNILSWKIGRNSKKRSSSISIPR